MTGQSFDGKVAVVTGAGSGIGAAVVRRLVDEGCSAVVALDFNERSLDRYADDDRVETACVDVSSAAHVNEVFGDVAARHGRIDVVVHAAGVDDPESKQVLQQAADNGVHPLVTDSLRDEVWRRVMSVNLDGTFYVLRAAARVMVPQRSGAIVTVGSSAAFDCVPGYGGYVASKAGAQALSQSVAKELAYFGVRVNTVAPGPVATGMAERTPPHVRQALESSGPRGYASPEELADNITYLASDAAVNVIGVVLLSNGGRFTV